MKETKKNNAKLPNLISDNTNIMVPMEYKNMSDFVVDAMKFFNEEKNRLEVIESLKNGYKEMSKLNLKLAEIGLEQDIMDLAIYEANLKRCKML